MLLFGVTHSYWLATWAEILLSCIPVSLLSQIYILLFSTCLVFLQIQKKNNSKTLKGERERARERAKIIKAMMGIGRALEEHIHMDIV